jgi:hypothetical protein
MVDSDYLVIESCSKLRVPAAIHADVCPHIVALCDACPPIAKSRPFKRHPATYDCHEAAAGL